MKFLIYAAVLGLILLSVRGMLRPSQSMSPAEAAKLLEVPLDADASSISAAHKRLIERVHPDKGGSAELAARVNQARDILLRRLG
jgi:hypothetical protein